MMHSISIKLIITSHSYSFSLLFLWYEGLRSSLSTCQYTVITMQCYYYRTPVDRSSAAAAAKSLQSRLTLCDPTDGSPPGSAIPGILQARTLEWVAISFFHSLWLLKIISLIKGNNFTDFPPKILIVSISALPILETFGFW